MLGRGQANSDWACISYFVFGPAGGAPAAATAVDPGLRAVALRCIAGACESGQLLVDVFVNFDCDLEGANLFERLVCPYRCACACK